MPPSTKPKQTYVVCANVTQMKDVVAQGFPTLMALIQLRSVGWAETLSNDTKRDLPPGTEALLIQTPVPADYKMKIDRIVERAEKAGVIVRKDFSIADTIAFISAKYDCEPLPIKPYVAKQIDPPPAALPDPPPIELSPVATVPQNGKPPRKKRTRKARVVPITTELPPGCLRFIIANYNAQFDPKSEARWSEAVRLSQLPYAQEITFSFECLAQEPT